MSTILDRAVRALHPLFAETSDRDGGPLSYCCDGPCGDAACGGCPDPCGHQACAVVHAIEGAGLLGYALDDLREQGRRNPARWRIVR